MTPTIEQIRAERQANSAFEKWRQRVIERLPTLATRVFALREKFYMGCGFHWGLEKELGTVISRLNNYDENYYHGQEGISNRVILEVTVEGLHKRLREAEDSAVEMAKRQQ